MRRASIVAVIFMLVIGGAEVAARVASAHLPDPAPWPTNETEVKDAQMAALGDIDVVFLGTSVTEAAVDPAAVDRALTIRAYNAALPFATQRSLLVWMRDFVIPDLHPRLIVLGIPEWGMGLAPPSPDDPLLEGLLHVEEFRDPQNPLIRLARHSALVRYRTEIKEAGNLLEPRFRIFDGGLTADGREPRYGDWQFDGSGLIEDPAPAPPDVSTVAELVRSARASGAEVAFMFEPSTCDPDGHCLADAGVTVVRNAYSELASMLGVPVIEVPRPWPLEWYADPAHFNQTGTDRFTAGLIPELRSLIG